MLCERCHKRLATQRYTEVIDGAATARSLCKNCLDTILSDAGSGFDISGAAPAPNEKFFKRTSSDRVARHIICKSCGMDLADALQSSVLGCAMCYKSFADHLPAVLNSMQPGIKHRGKTPKHQSGREQLNSQLYSKRTLLRAALKTENYEEAARLRDEINQLESELNTEALSQ